MPYYEKIIESGNYVEVIRYKRSVRQDSNKKKLNSFKKSRVSQKNQNIKNAKKKLTRIIRCNFINKKATHITLTFNTDLNEKLARLELKNFLRRLDYVLKKDKKELKYIATGGYSKKDKLHFHLLINICDLNLLISKWEKNNKYAGRVSTSRYDEENSSGLASYFIKNGLELVKHQQSNLVDGDYTEKLIKKYTTSQNMIKPKIVKTRLRKSLDIREVPKEYKKYKMLNFENVATDWGIYQRVEFIKINRRLE